MPDAPDWHPYRLESEKFPLSDLAELAVRLGSPVFFDRRGDVLWYDRMQDDRSAWNVTLGGTGGAQTVITSKTYWPGKALRLVAGSTINWYAGIIKYFAPSRVGGIGLEVTFALANDYDRFRIILTRYDGADFHRAAVRLHFTDNELQYMNSSGTWTRLDDLVTVIQTTAAYMNLKLVCDFEDNEYMRCMFNQNEYDLSGVPIYEAAVVQGPYLTIEIAIMSQDGDNATTYIGNVVVTQNEL